MTETGTKNPKHDLSSYGFKDLSIVNWNWSQDQLIDRTVEKGLGEISDSGALTVDTGEFTGRAPKDKYNVKDAYACADPKYRLSVRVISELPWAAMFAGNMFIRPGENELKTIDPDWVIVHAPSYKTDPKRYGIRSGNFAVLNFTRKMIIIGGSAYTGEIKKGIFTVLNYVLPQDRGVLSMHCSANIGKEGDTAIFFGLSGTGKTTLSADPNRGLIGDDEHGWSDDSVFNFEGGCYAKCVNLTEEKEPEIFHAIKRGALLENVRFFPET